MDKRIPVHVNKKQEWWYKQPEKIEFKFKGIESDKKILYNGKRQNWKKTLNSFYARSLAVMLVSIHTYWSFFQFWLLPCVWEQKMDLSIQQERVNSLFLWLFVLFHPSVDGMMPAHLGEGHLF